MARAISKRLTKAGPVLQNICWETFKEETTKINSAEIVWIGEVKEHFLNLFKPFHFEGIKVQIFSF